MKSKFSANFASTSATALQLQPTTTAGRWRKIWRSILTNYQLYLFLLPTVLYFIVFKYWPMYGVIIAFKNFNAVEGILGSRWVGLKHFERFFSSYNFWPILGNTLTISIYSLIVSFPLPVILALLLNQFTYQRLKRLIQTVIYAPTFISTVVLVGMLYVFLAPQGLVNSLIRLSGGEPILFMARPEWFASLYAWSGAWAGTGFATIVYLAALAGVDPMLHEAAIIDGANKWQRIWYIDLPSIMPTVSILFILAVGGIMNVGFEKVLLMQTSLNISASQVIQTYVYDVGILNAQYSFSAAVGLFNSMINFILLIVFNSIARRMGQASLW
jgi:putative aldouronate transport system permease protein